MELRPVQQECVDHAIKQNTIVNLPTGLGKTLIAVKVIDYFLEEHPTTKVAMIVPTRPLVDQQGTYCQTHCQKRNGSKINVIKVCGPDSERWSKSDWDKQLMSHHVVVGTPEIFRQLLATNKFAQVSQFSLFVFDECHNAVGNSPMACIMMDAVVPYYHSSSDNGETPHQHPRVLGLTASFVSGAMKNPEKKKRKLETLLVSTVICPDVESRLPSESFERVSWHGPQDKDEAKRQRQLVADLIEDHLSRIKRVGEIKKVARRCCHVFDELGKDALIYFAKYVVADQIIEKARMLHEAGINDEAVALANQMIDALPDLEIALQEFVGDLETRDELWGAQARSHKLERLISLIQAEMFPNEALRDGRALVFVEQVALVSPLAHELTKSLGHIKIGCVAGGTHQADTDRTNQLDKFRLGDMHLLVSTSALEEGMDVPECKFVVRFTAIATTRAHVQGSGRARHAEAKVYMFENDPILELQKEAKMTSVARDKYLSLRGEALASEAKRMAEANMTCGCHPYPPHFSAKGQVSVFNAKKIFNEYCSLSLRRSISPEKELYIYDQFGDREILVEVLYPTPKGWHAMTDDEYREFWSETNLDLVFHEFRSVKKTRAEREEMAFIYAIVVKLREAGLLTDSNQPDEAFVPDTLKLCTKAAPLSPMLSVKNVVVPPVQAGRR